MKINDLILGQMTENSLVNNALLHSSLDIDVLAREFFKLIQDAVVGLAVADKNDMCEAERITGLPSMVIGKINSGDYSVALAKLALLLATGVDERVDINPREVFKASITQASANPDSDKAGFWLAMAAKSARQVQVDDNECPF